jgi:hypothetical protein
VFDVPRALGVPLWDRLLAGVAVAPADVRRAVGAPVIDSGGRFADWRTDGCVDVAVVVGCIS